MAVPADTFTAHDAIGNREDLTDVIYNTDPIDKPFMRRIRSTNAYNVTHEWQTDVLDAPDGDNARVEGDDATTTATTPTVRLNNVVQISDKVPRVSGTQQAAVSAGRRDELAYQIYLKTLSLGRDMETILTSAQARNAGSGSTARKLGGLEAWTATNASRGSGGSGAGGGAAPVDGTQRPFTEDLLKPIIREVWDNGGNPDTLMLGSFNKQAASTFTGNATRMKTAEDRQLVATVDIYQSDFSDLEIVPNRFQRSRSAHVLQTDLWAVAYYRPPRVANLAKTGDSERRQVLAEYSLQASNEKGSGIIADLTTS